MADLKNHVNEISEHSIVVLLCQHMSDWISTMGYLRSFCQKLLYPANVILSTESHKQISGAEAVEVIQR